MNEFELIKNYLQKISKKNPSSLKLNDDVFFNKKNILVVSVDTYVEGNHFHDFTKPDFGHTFPELIKIGYIGSFNIDCIKKIPGLILRFFHV